MEARILDWLQTVGWTAFWISAVLFVAVNAFGIAMIVARRDRQLVNTWTSRFLATNLVLVSTGLGIPLLTTAARLAVSVSAPVVRGALAPMATSTSRSAELAPE